MLTLFDYFENRFWREMMINRLDIWSMLAYIQTNKHINKNKKYVYMLIFQKIVHHQYNEVNESYVFQPVPIGKNPIGIGYYICKICDRIIETPFVLIYNKDNIMILLQHSKSIRNMVVKYMKSMNSKSERYKELDTLLQKNS